MWRLTDIVVSLSFADEGNWRNDYPDEDEGLSDSSQERRFYEDYGFDSGELHCSLLIKQGRQNFVFGVWGLMGSSTT